MVRKILAIVLLGGVLTLWGYPCIAQDSEVARKVVNKVTPAYPPLARQMHISGNVRLEAVVSPNGKVAHLDVKGGHPVLVQAATDAVSQWKWETASHESRETVELKFLPSE